MRTVQSEAQSPRSFVTQGEGSGQHGEMVNVLRVFNDATGVVSPSAP
ncbi:MAG: hypothetical protein ACKVI4_17130 [Actinomycetales bacterium]